MCWCVMFVAHITKNLSLLKPTQYQIGASFTLNVYIIFFWQEMLQKQRNEMTRKLLKVFISHKVLDKFILCFQTQSEYNIFILP